ncbi:MAG TPA: S-layer homology domain-containing protein, partial [Candidatus Obscuribacterales bacterium]
MLWRAVWQHWTQPETLSYVPAVAACTLLTLVAGSLAPEAKADVVVPVAAVPEPGSAAVSTSAADLMATPAIAPPESTPTTEFTATSLPTAQPSWSPVAVEQAVTVDNLVPTTTTAQVAPTAEAPAAVVAASPNGASMTASAQPKQLAPEPMAIALEATTATDLRPDSAGQKDTAPAIAPLATPQPKYQLAQVSSFSDIQGHWAQSVIESLAARDVVRGFPDGTFRPDLTVTRAQFAAIVRQAFQVQPVRTSVQFSDVSANYWGYSAIDEAYRSGFVSAASNNLFRPEQGISRDQALVGLVNGLKLTSETTSADILETYFEDAAQVAAAERTDLAIATEKRLVASYPNVRALNPQQLATRAEVATF